ncbi:iron dicitrate transport regulator FecR [Neorhodopirellula lusitana]|uniref:iron dicitrate transport regulator FecR n=1 Tax=Neorhodopirellula lusitana TaxID=445327 RepID=UPI00384D11C5
MRQGTDSVMDQDLQRLLEAWLSSEPDANATAPLVERLRQDAAFRKAFVDELAMLGQLKAVQSSQPRWLELEDVLSSELEQDIATPRTLGQQANEERFESKVMTGIGETSRHVPKRSSATYLAAIITGLATAATIIGVQFWMRPETIPPSVAQAPDNSTGDAIDVAENQNAAPLSQERENANTLSTIDAVAVLSQSVGVQWSGDRKPEVGDSLNLGDFVLDRGTVQLDFLAGVRLLLRGPADIELRAPDEVLLRHGSASCFVSEMGRGFRIVTSEMEVIDLGTAFSIEVEEGRQPEVHVLEGSVEIHSEQQNSPLELTEQKAIQMSKSGPESVLYAPQRFPQISELHARQRANDRQKFEQWKKGADLLSQDPAVLLHYTFEEAHQDGLALTNHAADSSQATDGAVIGCQWAPGRWRNKRALLYRKSTDRVMFQVPGAFDELTFMVWARIDALTQPITSLLMTENPARRQQFSRANDQSVAGAFSRLATSNVKTVRWEISQAHPNVMFSVGHGQEGNWRYDTCPVQNPATHPDNWGVWECLAVTCNATKREVTHYRNGEPIGTCRIKNADPLLLDFMELGNFGATREELEKSKGSSQRRFFGAIDELVIARRVMTAEEIKTFWSNGKP